jgi:hypothetical protein
MAFEGRSAVVVRKRTWLAVLATLWPLVATSFAAAIVQQLFHRIGPGWGLAIAQIVLLAPTMALFVAWGRWRRAEPRRVSVREGALVVDGAFVAKRATLRAALVYAHAGKTFVRIHRGWSRPNVEVGFDDAADAHALVDALGLDPKRSTASVFVQLAHEQARAIAALLLGLVVFFVVGYFSSLRAGEALPLLVVAYVPMIRMWGTLKVGPDGLLLKRALGRARFIPYADVARVSARAGNTHLELASGEKLALQAGAKRWRAIRWMMGDDAGIEGEALATAIESARRRHVDGTERRAEEALLERRARPVDDWLRAMHAIGAETATFRSAPLRREDLWRVVEDPAAEATARAGAAAALSRALDDTERARLRVAAESCVAPKLRVAFDAVAKGADDGEVAEKLEAVKGAR